MSWLSSFLAFRKPSKRQRVNAETLFSLIEHQFESCLYESCDIRLGDRDYVSLSDQEAFVCVRNVTTRYAPQTNDCDDLSNLAKGECIRKQRNGAYDDQVAAFGQAWLTHHAVNFYLHHSGELRIINNNGALMPLSTLSREITLLLA